MHTLQELTDFIKTNITSLALLCAFAQSNAISLWILVLMIIVTYCVKIILARYEASSHSTSWLLVYRTYKLLMDFTIYYFTYIFARKVSMFLTYLTNSDSVSDFFSLVSPILSMILLVAVITLIEYSSGLIILLPPAHTNNIQPQTTTQTLPQPSTTTQLSRALTAGNQNVSSTPQTNTTNITHATDGGLV